MNQSVKPGRAVEILPASPADREDAARVLAAAFAADEHTVGLLPTGDRHRRLTSMFSLSVSETLRAGGHVWLARDPDDDRLLGVAVWQAPGESRGVLSEVRSGVAHLRVHGRRLLDAALTQRVADAHRPRVPHWYLAVIGTDPDARGRGVGSALIRHRLTVADARGYGTYLESSSPANVPVYRRYGFTEVGTIPSRGTTPLIGMWRPARTASV